MPKLIGLGHYSRVGKDTFARMLREELEIRGVKTEIKPFAWKLKQICHELYGWAGVREPEFYDSPEGERFRDIKLYHLGMTPVELWVAFGAPAVRDNVYRNTWVDYVVNTPTDAEVVIIPDVRFLNEALTVKASDGVLIKMVREGYGPRDTVADRALLDFNDWDAVYGGDLDDLRFHAENVAARIDADHIIAQTEAWKYRMLALESSCGK